MTAQNLEDLADECEQHRLKLPEGSRGADKSGAEWVIAGIEEAAKSTGRRFNVRYLQAILDRWRAEGYAHRNKSAPVAAGVSEADRRKYLEGWGNA